MTKNQFKKECQRLEDLGYSLVDYEPERKYAKYVLSGLVKIVGGGK